MKKYNVLVLFSLLLNSILFAQKNVEVSISHELKGQAFEFNQVSSNNLGHTFKVDRLEYYISRFSIIHDGGQIIAVDDSVIALVQAGSKTILPLGLFAFTKIEGIKFHIGVYSPINNADPAQHDEDHPLSPKSPSMHWGWNSGYRFAVIEGFGGIQLNQDIELHGLGNQNYFETTVSANSIDVAGNERIELFANYAGALQGIALNSGVISHGTTDQAAQMLTNFKNHVFYSQLTAGIEENKINDLKIYPIPSFGEVFMNWNQESSYSNLEVYTTQGQLVNKMDVSSQFNAQLKIETAGTYLVRLSNEAGSKSEQLIVIH